MMAKAKRFDVGGDIADLGKGVVRSVTAIPQAALRALGIKSGLEGDEGSALLEKAMKDKDAERRMAMQSMAPSGVIGAAGAAMKKGGTASSRADGIASRGKTKGRFV
jgi:hypothetical protein